MATNNNKKKNKFLYRGDFDFTQEGGRETGVGSRKFDRIITKFFDALEKEGFEPSSISFEPAVPYGHGSKS